MIDSYSFGDIIINGKSHEDIKICNKKIIPWHYIEHHTVTLQDVIEIFETKPNYLVIGIGASGLVTVKQEVIDYAKKHNIKLIIEPTAKAVQEFNKLEKENKKVGAILHATC